MSLLPSTNYSTLQHSLTLVILVNLGLTNCSWASFQSPGWKRIYLEVHAISICILLFSFDCDFIVVFHGGFISSEQINHLPHFKSGLFSLSAAVNFYISIYILD